MLMAPTRAYMKAVNVAAQAFLRTVSKTVGGEVLDDALGFFNAFEGMEAGFRDRAARVQALLADRCTAFVLVASPRADTVEEASFFAGKLGESSIPVEALVVNRMHPRFGEGGRAEADRARAETLAGTPLGALYANLADFREMADGEEAYLAGLTAEVAPAPVVRVPFLADDVHDLDTLAEIGSYLFPK
jgi:anion-transporting  ArsA/GET3 family ATPase